MKDALGARMKADYEHRARVMLPRRTHTIVRVDGKSFHTYTRGLDRPFDPQLLADMHTVAAWVAPQLDGCRIAYTQSDEISFVLTDFATDRTEAWFDGNQQKIATITASLVTAKFNELRPGNLAVFDGRAFTIPDPVEVVNYLLWRQQDAVRNSVHMAARAHMSHKRLHGVSAKQAQELLWAEHGVNWNDYDPRFKRGSVAAPEIVMEPVVYTDKRTGQDVTLPDVSRRRWRDTAAPRFGAHRDWLTDVLADRDVAIPQETTS